MGDLSHMLYLLKSKEKNPFQKKRIRTKTVICTEFKMIKILSKLYKMNKPGQTTSKMIKNENNQSQHDIMSKKKTK